ncbi:RNA polymerase sigma factor SigX [Paraliobacillus sp. PM-2]|uniref:RNA polymerase sigma factor n=1 Tax=Paraliobacillus sp. PM-2 TaxID=1462524 RepID=UPI00061BCD2E|nr:RNA polymerase sigma factor [Paraliobacillus sp. PM-2]CQR47198.1 RNA polymerase sigma factor SigX [Paraliobacillus sp. PM-2]
MTTSSKISEWFYAYNKDIYHFLLYYIGSGDIDDLVQEVFIKAIKGVDTYKEQSSPKTWLLSIARNVGIDELRKRKRERLKQQIAQEYYEMKDEKTPDIFLYLDERKQHLYQVIHSLKPSYRDVIILRAIKELTIAETSDVLHWPQSKVRITYH